VAPMMTRPDDLNGAPGERTSAFFGRRKGRPLRTHQAQAMETVLPSLAIDLTAPATQELGRLFGQRTDIRLEIGFGGGEHLVTQAAHNPDVGFIGCEGFINGIAKTVTAVSAAGLDNVRIHAGDAAELIAWLPDAAVSCVDLLYPDPWPKRRHWKRRFVQDDSLDRIARILTPGGCFRFASDIPDYIAWTLERVLRNQHFTWTAEKADDWRRPWPGFCRTRYEAKALREGRTPCYLVSMRK
jgi:tRNA (guanine-N7-)-methyltransferase